MGRRVETESLDGYIIASRYWHAKVQIEFGIPSFGRTPAEAWRRHLGPEQADSPDYTTYVQSWSDKGYIPIAVSVSVSPAPVTQKEKA